MYVDSTLPIDWNRGVSTPSRYLQRPSLAVPVEDSRANLKKEMWVPLIIKCLSRLQRSGRFRVRENVAFVFCGRKAFGGNIIKPGHLIRFVPFPFCYTPKQLQPAEGRF